MKNKYYALIFDSVCHRLQTIVLYTIQSWDGKLAKKICHWKCFSYYWSWNIGTDKDEKDSVHVSMQKFA